MLNFIKKQKRENMEYKVNLHEIDDDDNKKYNGYIETILTFHGLKINWRISDCGSYPSDQWIELLNFMKGNSTSYSPIINPGGPSSWNARVNNSIFELCFDISGGDCSLIHEFPVDKMIPVVEQIIEKIKQME